MQHQEVEVEIPSGRLEIGPRGEVSWRPSLVMGLLLFMETKGNDESSVLPGTLGNFPGCL